MDTYFSISFCLGPFPNLTEEIIGEAIDHVVKSYGPTEFGKLWENFSFGEDLLEEVAEEVGDDVALSQGEVWRVAVRKKIKERLIHSATEVYLTENNEATQRIIEGKSWIFSGGQTWDGETTAIAKDIDFVRWSGLDQAIYKIHNLN